MGSKSKKFAIGALVAAVVGYLAGILTAPKSGKETRKDIQDVAVKTKQQAEKQLKKLHSDLDGLISQGKSAAEKLTGKSKDEWFKLVGMATSAKESVREVLSALHEGDADDKDLDKAIKQASEAVDSLKSYLKKNVKI